MSDDLSGDDTGYDDLLPDDLLPAAKGKAQPLKRTKKQQASARKAEERREQEDLRAADQAAAQQLAQIVNLTIAGRSYADIGAAIGKTASEIEQMLVRSAGAYIRTQPALRTYVRNFISEKYIGLLDAVYDEATNKNHAEKLENSAQALRILKELGRLHGAEAPVQSEVKVEAAPETVEKMVAALARAQGVGYDMNVFDIVDGELVEDAHAQSLAALEQASLNVEADQPEDHDWNGNGYGD